MFRQGRFGYLAIVAMAGLATLISACAGGTGTPTPPQKTEIVSYTFSPPSPATLKFGEYVTANLTYTSGHSTPIRMWARIDYNGPITEGTIGYCPSPAIQAKQGTEERCFRVQDAYVNGVPSPIHVDTIRFSVVDQDQTVQLYEEFVTVDYIWEP